MIGKYLSTGAASGSQWVAAGYLMLPLVFGSLFGGVFALLMRVFGWPASVVSFAPISIMFGALAYVVVMAIDPMVSGNFTPQAIWSGIAIALIATWPIAFVMGPLSVFYIAHLKRGRKSLKDSTVILIAILCLMFEFALRRHELKSDVLVSGLSQAF